MNIRPLPPKCRFRCGVIVTESIFRFRDLQEATGKIGSLLDLAFAEGKFSLTPEQRGELRDRLSDILWCATLLCKETGMSLQDVAAHSIAQLEAPAKDLDPDRR
jgi:hypothetical protein